MKGKPPLTLAEMAARSAGTGGRLVCPKCGCADFKTYGTIPGYSSTFRYKRCRHCGQRLFTNQVAETVVRIVDTPQDDRGPLEDDVNEDLL